MDLKDVQPFHSDVLSEQLLQLTDHQDIIGRMASAWRRFTMPILAWPTRRCETLTVDIPHLYSSEGR
jgi:hypothetical protein